MPCAGNQPGAGSPLRAHARGISANGQTSSQQWQVQVTSASASVAILPLLQRTVEIYAADAENVDFRLRPRPKPDKDYAAIRDFFPPIEGRDPDSPAVPKPPRKAGEAWRIVVNNGHAHGEHSFWIFQLRGAAAGDLYADVSHETRGGPLAVNNGKADIKLQTLTLNRDWEVSRDGTVKGEFAMASFVPAEHRGLKALAFLTLDAEVKAPVDSLDFLDFYLRSTNGLELDGQGELAGRLHYDKGSLLPGSDVAVAATELVLKATPFTVRGDGEVKLSVAEAAPELLTVSTGFQALEAFHDDSQSLMFSGERLQVDIQGPAGLLNFAEQQGQRRVVVNIPEMAVPDLQVYQAFLPDKWPFRLLGGNGKLTGQGELTAQSLSAELNLLSENADVAFKDFRFRSNLDTGIRVSAGGRSDNNPGTIRFLSATG